MGGLFSFCLGGGATETGPIVIPKWEASAVIGNKGFHAMRFTLFFALSHASLCFYLGVTIKSIEQESGAKVSVRNEGDQAIITFSGEIQSIAKARALVQKKISGAENVGVLVLLQPCDTNLRCRVYFKGRQETSQ
jgi:hypothetical protein